MNWPNSSLRLPSLDGQKAEANRLTAEQIAQLPPALQAYLEAPPLSDPVPMPDPVPLDQIGDDERRQVHAVNQSPWQRICELQMRDQHGRWSVGTGWLAGPSTVLTAAHNLLNLASGHHAVEVIVVPGRDGALGPHGWVSSNAFAVHPGWQSHGASSLDVGVIWLPFAYGTHLGVFRYQAASDAALNNAKLGLAGYPIDKPAGTMWYAQGAVSIRDTGFLGYEIDCEDGQSGSPLFAGDPAAPVAFGVHVQGRVTRNFAVRLTPSIVSQFDAWIR